MFTNPTGSNRIAPRTDCLHILYVTNSLDPYLPCSLLSLQYLSRYQSFPRIHCRKDQWRDLDRAASFGEKKKGRVIRRGSEKTRSRASWEGRSLFSSQPLHSAAWYMQPCETLRHWFMREFRESGRGEGRACPRGLTVRSKALILGHLAVSSGSSFRHRKTSRPANNVTSDNGYLP